MSDKHQEILQGINPNLKIISRFSGGMSNYTYLVSDSINKYTFRIPGTGANNFCNYTTEESHLELISNLNINSNTIYFNSSSGIKISNYIEGETLNNISNKHTDVVTLLRNLHQSNLTFSPYQHLTRLATYEVLANNSSTQYQKLKKQFTQYYDTELKNHINYPCHCDAQQSNFIFGTSLYLLDWEFAGQNDYIYDIASFGNINFNDALELLQHYHPNTYQTYYFRLYAWRAYQCLQWHNVALYKHNVGLGNDLGIDFEFVSHKYLNLAQEMLQNANNYKKNLKAK